MMNILIQQCPIQQSLFKEGYQKDLLVTTHGSEIMILTERKQSLVLQLTSTNLLSGGDEQQTDVQALTDVPSANTRSRRPILVVPDKVPQSDMEMAAQTYEEFSDLFTSEQVGPEKAFQAAVSEHPIYMF
eukprot:2339447-Ditylum_brightwellii.AAC.1